MVAPPDTFRFVARDLLKDSRGHRVAPGIYFCRLEMEGEAVARKIAVLKQCAEARRLGQQSYG